MTTVEHKAAASAHSTSADEPKKVRNRDSNQVTMNMNILIILNDRHISEMFYVRLNRRHRPYGRSNMFLSKMHLV